MARYVSTWYQVQLPATQLVPCYAAAGIRYAYYLVQVSTCTHSQRCIHKYLVLLSLVVSYVTGMGVASCDSTHQFPGITEYATGLKSTGEKSPAT
jgi:hypothetical protein